MKKNLYIKAINPGYTIDGLNNVGEMIEISRKNSDAPISLAGTAISYTNSSGNNSTLFEFVPPTIKIYFGGIYIIECHILGSIKSINCLH